MRMRFVAWALVVLASVSSAWAQSVRTVAGGASEDGRPAVAVSIRRPDGLATDAAGNLFITDSNHRVLRLNAETQRITTFAGNGAGGFAGDGGPSTASQLNRPGALVVHGNDLYISDTDNHRIRKANLTSGIITTVAGNGLGTGISGDGGPATAAGLDSPAGIAVDSASNVFFVDANSRIRKITSATATISTIAGGFDVGFGGDGGPAIGARFNVPRYLTIDAEGNLYVADLFNHRVRKISAASGVITTAAGTGSEGFDGDQGPATAARLYNPDGVAIDSEGNLYISDTNNARIRKVAASSGIITTFAGSAEFGFSGDGGPATAARLSGTAGLTFGSAGDLFLADLANNRVRRVTADGVINTVAGNGSASSQPDNAPATAAQLGELQPMALDKAGNLYIPDSINHRILRLDPRSGLLTTVAGTGVCGLVADPGDAGNTPLCDPRGVAIDSRGNLYIAGFSGQRILMVDRTTGVMKMIAGTFMRGFAGDGGPATAAQFNQPRDVAVDVAGNVYVADEFNHRIRKIAADTGIITTVAGNGSEVSSGDGGPATAAGIFVPRSIDVDSKGNLYIVSLIEHRIRRVAADTGIITTFAGEKDVAGFTGDGGPASNARLLAPADIAFDALDNLYIVDSGNHRIRRVSANGNITTVAGSGARDSNGDGGPAASAGIGSGAGIAVGVGGDLYFTDGSRVRAIYTCVDMEPPRLTAPSDGSRTGSSLKLSWQKVSGAFSYDLHLGVSATDQPLIATDIHATTYPATNLQSATTYYWRVVANGDPFCPTPSSGTSVVRSFTTVSSCNGGQVE